jgi:site-specific recombinase XerD
MLTRNQREQPSEFVFGSNPRAALKRVQRQLAQIKTQPGVKFGFHALRGTFARQLLAAGMNLMVMCSILGLSVRGLDSTLKLRRVAGREKDGPITRM